MVLKILHEDIWRRVVRALPISSSPCERARFIYLQCRRMSWHNPTFCSPAYPIPRLCSELRATLKIDWVFQGVWISESSSLGLPILLRSAWNNMIGSVDMIGSSHVCASRSCYITMHGAQTRWICVCRLCGKRRILNQAESMSMKYQAQGLVPAVLVVHVASEAQLLL